MCLGCVKRGLGFEDANAKPCRSYGAWADTEDGCYYKHVAPDGA